MRCYVQTRLNAPADAVWSAVKRPQTLLHVTRGFLKFSATSQFPQEWHKGDVVQTRLIFFHTLPGWWKHTLSVAEVDGSRLVIRSHETGGFYTWDHTIRVTSLCLPILAHSPGSHSSEERGENRNERGCDCQYSDEIDIHAGLLTAFIWLYANVFYRYRQMRWRRLARKLEKG